MNEDLARDYLRKSDFSPMQADALARLLDEMATRDDLRVEIEGLESRLRTEIARMRVDLARWGIALIIAMSTIFTLLDVFID